MSPKIRILDQHCVNQIAAGEVIERPLSVIKELVENSLDASADKIEITVAGRGTSLIRIKDNGIGIPPEDIELAVMPHATSKIDKIQDLDSLNTLGFRGEALASIASVSRFTIISRTTNSIAGTELKVDGGRVVSCWEIGSPPGTTITVEDLFYNTPARLKFLSSDATEFGLISDMVSKLSLSRPDVSFTLRRPHTTVFSTSGRGDVLDTMASVLGSDTARKLIQINHREDNLEISGYISLPDFSRSSRQGITFIVNGRVIRSKLLNTALKNGYHTLLPANMYPTAVIYLSLPSTEYDVNVHPAKLEIKFRSEKALSKVLSSVVQKTLIENRPVSRFNLIAYNQVKDTQNDNNTISNTYIADSLPNPYPSPKHNDLSASQRINTWEQIKMYYTPQMRQSPGSAAHHILPEVPAANDNQDPNHSFFFELRPIGQLFNTYILTTDEKGFFIVDQHAAHERIRYEGILEQYRVTQAVSQMLLVPETVNLTLQEEQIVLAHFDELHNMGFILEHFGDRTYLIRGVPILNTLQAQARVFKMFLDEIIDNPASHSEEKLVERWIFVLACRSAIKANERLSQGEMEELIMKLGNTENPYSCPHGRPTIIEISKKELDSKFGR